MAYELKGRDVTPVAEKPTLIEKPKKISPNQQKAFYIAARNRGMDDEAITSALRLCNVDHIQDVPAEKFDQLLDFVREWQKPEPENPQDESKAPAAT